MARRRRDEGFDGLIGPIAVALFVFGAFIIAFLKVLILVSLIAGGVPLACFLLFRVGRSLWHRQLDIEAYLPQIDWTSLSVPDFDTAWAVISYPEFSPSNVELVPHVIGTSGAWKDVIGKSECFPALRSASKPRELQQRVAACEAAASDILCRMVADADELARQRLSDLENQILRLHDVEQDLTDRVQPRLDWLQCLVETLYSSHFLDRLRAERLANRLSEYKAQLRHRRHEARARATSQEKAVRDFLDPVQRERTIRERMKQDLTAMKGILASKEFAGAIAEVAVIDELSSIPADSLIFNDVKMESERYLKFGGKALMSAQVDTLAITPNGVFVIEVKNWSREFAQSGEGFNPYEQASRASHLVWHRLHSAGISVKVRAIIANYGSLPEKDDHKVAVVSIGRLRKYIEGAPPAQLDIAAVRSALGL